MVAASFAVRDGEGVHISVPSDAKLRNIETTVAKGMERLSETIAGSAAGQRTPPLQRACEHLQRCDALHFALTDEREPQVSTQM